MAKTIKKAQYGKDVPKGYVRGEMTGKLIPEKEQKAWEKSDWEDFRKFKEGEAARIKAASKPAPKPAPKPKAVMPKKKMKDGGKTTFGMLSVKAGVDKNPKPTAADRIAGAKMKAGKMKKGGKIAKKK